VLGSLALAATGGLLSSSCCTVQLALNYLSLGCAGFSAITPYQPAMRAATGSVLAYSVWRHGWRRSLATIALALGLMFSQELVKLYNQGALPGPAWLGGAAARRRAAAAPGAPATAARGQGGSRFTLRVGGIKCEGCASRLRRALLAQPGVRDAAVHFAEQQAVVWTRGAQGTQGVGFAELAFAIRQVDFGYQVSLLEEARSEGDEQQQQAADGGGQPGQQQEGRQQEEQQQEGRQQEGQQQEERQEGQQQQGQCAAGR
jgi:copper chaperone CopZ